MRYLGRLLISHWLLCPLLALLLLAGSLVNAPLLRLPELPLYDRLLQQRVVNGSDQVVLIRVDQQSRATLGEEIGNRAGLTRLLIKLQQLGVKQLALLEPLSFAGDPATDQALTEVLATFDTVLSLEALSDSDLTAQLPDTSLLPLPAPLPSPQQLLLQQRNPLADYRLCRPQITTFLPPAPAFNSPHLLLGQLQVSSDPDGKVRRLALLLPSDDGLLPALPMQLLLQRDKLKLDELQLPPRELPGELRLGSRKILLDSDYRLLLNLSGAARPYRQYSAAQLLDGSLDQLPQKDKLVLLAAGESASWQLANHGQASRGEIAALATATLLGNQPLRRPAWGWQAETLALAFFLALLLLLVPRLSTVAGLCAIGFCYLVWLGYTASSLINHGDWLYPIPALLLCLFGFPLVRWRISRRLRRRELRENERQLALCLLEQGRLDQALERFLRFIPREASDKELLYNLGLEFERKRMPHKAQSAYRQLLRGGKFRDAGTRLQQLQPGARDQLRPQNNDATIVLDRPGEKPTLGRYRIERELGQGAMGIVYLGIDPKINRQVAIKTLDYQRIDPDQLPAVKERFFREAEAAGRLNHHGIVTIYDVGEENDLAYLAMELLNGDDLTTLCRPDRLLQPAQVIALLHQVALALDYAHRQGVVHRDIKPANIVLQKNGQVKVVDFGVARVVSSSKTETGLILGTPSYMSPEQVAGKKVDGRSDLFSLGVVMYELLSGAKPFEGENLAALMYNIANCNYRPLAELKPDLPAGCRKILDKLLLKGVTRRYKSAALLASDLAELQRQLEKR